ncbi:hypothetical protein Tco_0429863, partial [Tanacetum coccineum]
VGALQREPEATKDTIPLTNNGSTKDVQPPVVPVVHHESISEPVNAPISASRPNQEEMMKDVVKKLTTKLRNYMKSFEI